MISAWRISRVNHFTSCSSMQSGILRKFCATTLRSNENSNNNTEGSSQTSSEIVTLYTRNTERNLLPRTAFGMSALNTAYWMWYTLDFIPTVNASPIESIHIDPRVGWGALALGVAINSVTAFYPLSLVAKLEYLPTTQQLQVYRHRLPFLNPSPKPTVHNLGDLSMDPASRDTKQILDTVRGGISKYEGHLGLIVRDSSLPLLLEIRESSQEIHNDEILLQALLNPQSLTNSFAKKVKQQRGRISKKQRGNSIRHRKTA